MHWWYTDGWWWGWFMMLMMAVFWIAVIAGIVLLIRWFAVRTPEARPAGEESAVEILRRRYARGELTREQFQEMRRDIEETGRAAGEAI